MVFILFYVVPVVILLYIKNNSSNMRKINLEHIIRAAADIIKDNKFYVIGSQSIFGQHPNLEDLLFQLKNEGKINDTDILNIIGSREADIIAISDNENISKADIIDGVIGELSPYHETHGYYADGVNENTAILPYDWKQRLNEICNENTRWVKAYCLDTHDLIVAKLFANREKDINYIGSLVKAGLVDESTVHERLDKVDIDLIENGEKILFYAHVKIKRIFSELKNGLKND